MQCNMQLRKHKHCQMAKQKSFDGTDQTEKKKDSKTIELKSKKEGRKEGGQKNK